MASGENTPVFIAPKIIKNSSKKRESSHRDRNAKQKFTTANQAIRQQHTKGRTEGNENEVEGLQWQCRELSRSFRN